MHLLIRSAHYCNSRRRTKINRDAVFFSRAAVALFLHLTLQCASSRGPLPSHPYEGLFSADDIQMSKCTFEIQINAEEQAERSGGVAQPLKRIFCSCRGARFNSRLSQGSSQLSVTARGLDVLLWPPQASGTHTRHIHAGRTFKLSDLCLKKQKKSKAMSSF